MSTSPGLGGYQKQSNYNDGSGSSYNYTHSHSPGTRPGLGLGSGTVHELNQSNPNFSSSPSNFSSTKFSQESNTFPSSGSASRPLRTSNNENGHNQNSGSQGFGPITGDPPRPGIGSFFEKPKDTATMGNSNSSIRTFSPGTKSNNQPDTDSKWTNAYVFNTGTAPGNLSSSVMDSLKPKWGPSRDELKDQLANSLSSDANISILPGFSSKYSQPSDGRRYFRTSASVPYLNYGGSPDPSDGTTERVPSAVTRAQNAIGRSRVEIGQAQSMIDMNKAKAQSLYRSPRGDAWSTMGTPGFGTDPFSVKRYKQDSYRKDLEQQIQQKQIRVAEERRQQKEGPAHPFGVSYNSPVPSHYEPSKLSSFQGNQKPNLIEEYTRLDSRISPRYQPKSVTNDVIGRSVQSHHFSQKRHFPVGGNTVTNPINHEQVNPGPVPRQPAPGHSLSQQRSPVMTQQQIPANIPRGPPPPIPAYSEQQSHPQYPYPYYPYAPQQQAYPYPVPPFSAYPPQYPVPPQMAHPMPHPGAFQPHPNLNPNAWPPNFKQQQQQPRDSVGRPGTSGPGQVRDGAKPEVKTKCPESPDDDDNNFDEDDCDIPMRMRIWQTSDQLPDPEYKKIAYKAQLKKQIIQKQKERADQMAKEVEEDQRQEKRMQEYQALMKTEIEMERGELARRCGDKERLRDLALQRAAEHYRMTQKMKSKKGRDLNDIDIDNNGCGDVRPDASWTSVSSSGGSGYETIASTEVDSPPVGQPVIFLPTTTNAAASALLQGPPKKVTNMNHLSQIQKILAKESKRLEQRLYCGDHSEIDKISSNYRRQNKPNFHNNPNKIITETS